MTPLDLFGVIFVICAPVATLMIGAARRLRTAPAVPRKRRAAPSTEPNLERLAEDAIRRGMNVTLTTPTRRRGGR